MAISKLVALVTLPSSDILTLQISQTILNLLHRADFVTQQTFLRCIKLELQTIADCQIGELGAVKKIIPQKNIAISPKSSVLGSSSRNEHHLLSGFVTSLISNHDSYRNIFHVILRKFVPMVKKKLDFVDYIAMC